VIVRDHEGQVLTSMCSSKPRINHATIARDLKIYKIILKDDAMKIVYAFQKDNQT
jgi:hypothetical protein